MNLKHEIMKTFQTVSYKINNLHWIKKMINVFYNTFCGSVSLT